MAVIGSPGTFHKKFKFIVQIDGLTVSEFATAGPLESSTAVVEQWQGGGLVAAAKDPGRVTFPNCVLTDGATNDRQTFEWYKKVSDAAKNAGDVDPSYKKNVDIVQQDRDGTTLKRWRLYEAWPCRFKAGEWDNGADENVMRELELCYRYFDEKTD